MEGVVGWQDIPQLGDCVGVLDAMTEKHRKNRAINNRI